MAGTILSVLVAAYRAGNRQPRGRVVENLKWLAFQASQKKVKGLPAGGTACRVNSYWTEKDYRDLLAGIHPGVSLAELAKVQGRTVGSIEARLQLLGLVHKDTISWRAKWTNFVYKTRLRPKLAGKGGHAIDLCDVLRGMGWLEDRTRFMLPDWLANMPVHIGKLQSARSTNKHVKEVERLVRDPNRSLHQLRFEGYAVISRRHRLVARVDREDWREALARDHAPWSPNGEGMRWAMAPGMADFYRRSHLCKDRMVIAENRWEAALRILPNSGSPEAPQDYQDFKL